MSPLYQQINQEFARGQIRTLWMNEMKGPWNIPEVKKVEEVCSVLWDRKGKRIRSQWVFWFGEALGIPIEELNLYAWAVEAIHTATLLHDDVIDKASLRRGGPSANVLFDNTLPILSGDYLLSDAIFQLAEKGHPLLVKLMCLAVKEVTQGEVLQYEQRYQWPKNSDYFHQLNRLKTSSLLKWAAQVSSVLSAGTEDPRLTELALLYGSLYQFTDDILDIRGTATKEAWQDLKEGKINEATFLLLENQPELKAKIQNALAQKKVTPELIGHFQDAIQKEKLDHYLVCELIKRRDQCLDSIQWLNNPQLHKTLDALIRFTVERLS